MPRKYWILLIAGVVVLALGASALGAALYFVPKYRAQQRLAEARALVAEGKFQQSRRLFSEYLVQNSDDTAVLEEYVDACQKIVADRRRALTDASRGLLRLVQLEPENAARKADVLAFYRRYRFWTELESTAKLYGGDLPSMTPEIAYDYVVAVHEQGKSEQAVADLGKYIELGHPLRDTPLRLARAHRALRDEAAAASVFHPLLERHPDDGMLRVYHAMYLLDESKAADAAEQLAAVPEALQQDADFLVASIRLKLLEQDFVGALAMAESATATYPDNIDLQLNHILALERTGGREAAIARIEGMPTELRADSPGFTMYLTEMYLEGNDAESADEARKAYAESYPDQQSVDQYLTGRILFVKNQLQEARDRFAIASRMNPSLHRATYYLAISELELGNKKAARIPLEQYLRDNPTDSRARRLWSQNFEEPRSRLELESSAKRILDGAPVDLEELFFLIQDMLPHRDAEFQEWARQLLEMMIAMAPADPRAYNTLAGFFLERGDTMSAGQVLERATAAGIDKTLFSMMSASILVVDGKKDEALSLARSYFDNSNFDDVRNWAVFFAGQGFYDEADSLVASFTGGGDAGVSTEEALRFRISLAVQHGALDNARARLAEAEAAFGESKDSQSQLNSMRLMLAEGLAASAPGDADAEIESLLAKVAAAEPQNEGLKIVRARMLLRQPLPDLIKARELVESIPEESEFHVQSLLMAAEIAITQGNYDSAETLARQILEESNANTQVLHVLADAQLGQRDPDGALQTLERILQLNRGDLRAMRVLVRVYEQLNLPHRADEMLLRFSETGRNRPNYAAQVAELREFLARSRNQDAPPQPDGSFAALTGEVGKLLSEQRFDEARARIEAYLKEHPNEAESWVYLGQVILAQGPEADLGAASSAFTRAQLIIPEYGPAQLGLIDVQVRSNNLAVAKSICESYLQRHDRDTEVMYRLATLLMQNDSQLEDAIAWVTKAISIEQRPEYIRLQAYLETRAGRHDTAIESLERLVKLSGGETAEDELIFCEAYLGLGQLDVARQRLKAARARIPETAAGLTARADALERKLAEGGN